MIPPNNKPENQDKSNPVSFGIGKGKDESRIVAVLEDGFCELDENIPDNLKAHLSLMNDIQNGKKIKIK